MSIPYLVYGATGAQGGAVSGPRRAAGASNIARSLGQASAVEDPRRRQSMSRAKTGATISPIVVVCGMTVMRRQARVWTANPNGSRRPRSHRSRSRSWSIRSIRASVGEPERRVASDSPWGGPAPLSSETSPALTCAKPCPSGRSKVRYFD